MQGTPQGPSSHATPRFEASNTAMGRRRAALNACLAFALALGLLPFFSAGEAAAAPESWADDIPDMLAAGSYAEGEVVVVMSGDAVEAVALETDGAADTVEPIMEIDAEAIESDRGDAAARSALGSASIGSISVVRSDTSSTEELLYALADDPTVISAEPNYTDIELTDLEADDEIDFDEAAPAAVANAEAASRAAQGSATPSAVPDLSRFQWAFAGGNTMKTPGSSANASINAPLWNQAGGNMDGEDVIVAILDGGIDTTHPDLVNSIYRFDVQKQKALGCGEFGFNSESVANPAVDPADVTDEIGHGTHCAGIIAAEWNGSGTSGVASNAKLMVIKNGASTSSLVDQLNAYAFIKKAKLEQGIDVQVTSNSWMLYQSSRALDAAVRDLGESCGIVSVFGAGNDGLDIDGNVISGGILKDNPYAVSVAGTNTSDELWSHSNYGKATVSLAAPAGGILSTVPQTHSSYFPDMVDPSENLIYEGFDGTASAFEASALHADGTTEPLGTGAIDTSTYFTGSGSLYAELEPIAAFGKSSSLFGIEFKATGPIAEPAAGTDAWIGFSLYSTNATLTVQEIEIKTTNKDVNGNAQWLSLSESGGSYLSALGVGQTWDTFADSLPTDASIDFDDFEMRVYLVSAGTLPVWIDSLGIGTQQVPYGYKNGTSMATPSVAGSTAVLAAKYPDDSAAERAARIKASVRTNPALADAVSSGGVIDLSIDGTPSADAYEPVIAGAEAKGTAATVRGSYFGSAEGAVAIEAAGLGDGPLAYKASIDSWTDTTIKITAEPALSGIVEVQVTTAEGASSTRTCFISPGDTVYENTLPLPTDDDPYSQTALVDGETNGILAALEGGVYSLPRFELIENAPFVQSMWRYDTEGETWTKAASLPEPLANASATQWSGKLLVKGTTMEILSDGVPRTWGYENPAEAGKAEVRVYAYDPADGSWTALPAAGIADGSTIASVGDVVVLVGGDAPASEDEDALLEEIAKASAVLSYDPKSGVLDSFATLAIPHVNPQAIASDGVLYVYDAQDGTFEAVENGQGTELADAFPAFADGDTKCAFAAVKGGIAMVGPLSQDGKADTYLLHTGETKFAPYAKRSSDARALQPAATSCNGKLYAMATSYIEPGGMYFRATAIETDEATTIPIEKDPADATGANDLAKTNDPIALPAFALAALTALAGVTGAATLARRKR